METKKTNTGWIQVPLPKPRRRREGKGRDEPLSSYFSLLETIPLPARAVPFSSMEAGIKADISWGQGHME